jgi:hypothetical protein
LSRGIVTLRLPAGWDGRAAQRVADALLPELAGELPAEAADEHPPVDGVSAA